MPRKRRAAKARRDSLTLRLELVDWLLDGRLRTVTEIDALHAEGTEYDGFLEFEPDWPPVTLPLLWRTHREALLAEAAHRGIQQPWAAQQGWDK